MQYRNPGAGRTGWVGDVFKFKIDFEQAMDIEKLVGSAILKKLRSEVELSDKLDSSLVRDIKYESETRKLMIVRDDLSEEEQNEVNRIFKKVLGVQIYP